MSAVLLVTAGSLAPAGDGAARVSAATVTVPSTTSPLHPLSTGVSVGPTGVGISCTGTIVYQTNPAAYTSPCEGIGSVQPGYGNVLMTHGAGLLVKVGSGPWQGIAHLGAHINGSGPLVLAVNDGLKGCPPEWGPAGCFADNSGAFTVAITPGTIKNVAVHVDVKGAASNDSRLLAEIAGGARLVGGPADPPQGHEIADYTAAEGTIFITFKRLGAKTLRLTLRATDGQLEVGARTMKPGEAMASVQARVVSTSDPKACKPGTTANLTFGGVLGIGEPVHRRLTISVCGKTYTFTSAETEINF